MKTIGDLYEAYIAEQQPFPELNYFYGYIPRTYYEATQYALSNYHLTINDEIIEKVKNILKDYHKQLGLLTPKVEENINNLDNGVVLAGQQSVIFGGPGLIANKIAAVVNISNISEKLGKKLTPAFLVNTHDSFQPEVATIHMPVKQSSSSKPISLKDYPFGVSINRIETNNYEWLEKSLSTILNIFREFNSLVPSDKKKLFLERVEHIITFLRETYRKAKNMGEWSTLIWGVQANIFNDWGVVFIPSSHEELRKINVKGYLPFLEQREKYITEFNNATERIKNLGLKPTTAKKKDDYVPFFYECPNDGYRIPLSYKEHNNQIFLEGYCPIEKKECSIVLDKNDIDLSSYAKYLSPRLDTNQATIQTLLPVVLRISGPGEINYNAQVIAANRAIGITLPLYVKYTRLLYNTPWIEELCKKDEVAEYSLLKPEFFKLIGKLGKAKRKGDREVIVNSCRDITATIRNNIVRLESIPPQPNTPLSIYKSWQFGMFDQSHHWQEVSWPWFIMASVTGLGNYIATYRRYYSPYSPIGQIGYLNTKI